MDPIIIDSAPKGSAILAYGTARQPWWNPKLLAIIAGSLALVAILAAAFWTLFAKVDLPTDRLFTAVIQPSALAKKIDPALQRDLPPPWRAALESGSHLPAIIGIALGADRQPHPFAVVARTARIAAEPEFAITRSGGFHLIVDHAISNGHEAVSAANAFHGAWSLRSGDLPFTLRADLLERAANGTSATGTPAENVEGAWNGRSGRLFMAPDHASSQGALAGPMFAILGDNTQDARPVAAGLLSQGIDVRGVEEGFPRSLAIDPANGGSIALSWPSLPANDMEGRLSLVQGTSLHRPLTLPDNSTINEIVPGTSSTGTNKGSTLLFLGDGMTSSTIDLAGNQAADAFCPGVVRFSIQGEVLQRVFNTLSVPASWQSTISRFLISEDDKTVHFCFE